MDRANKKRIYVKEEVCVGCRLCEVHCITAHSQYRNDIVKAFKKSSPRPLARIVVEQAGPLSFGLPCRHCDEPECVKSCITGAMRKDSITGVVTNDESRCIGCWTCILACPYGMIKRDFKGKKVASKCDFCIENGGDPACVKNCPNEALSVRELEEGCGKSEEDCGKSEEDCGKSEEAYGKSEEAYGKSEEDCGRSEGGSDK